MLLAGVPEFLRWSLCGGFPALVAKGGASPPFGIPAGLSVALVAIFRQSVLPEPAA